MYSKGKNLKAYLPVCSEQIRCYQLLRPCWELLCSPSQLKRTRNNGRRWVHRDMIKSRKMILCSIKAASPASCLSVSPSKKSDRAGQNILSDVFLNFTSRMWETENLILNFRLNLFYNGPANIPPYSAVSSHHHHHHLQKLLKDMTASIVSFQCCCRQADRRALSCLFWWPTPSIPPGKRIVCVKRQPCNVRCASETRNLRWVLRASTEVEQQQQRQWQWQQQRTSYTRNTNSSRGTQLCRRPRGL